MIHVELRPGICERVLIKNLSRSTHSHSHELGVVVQSGGNCCRQARKAVQILIIKCRYGPAFGKKRLFAVVLLRELLQSTGLPDEIIQQSYLFCLQNYPSLQSETIILNRFFHPSFLPGENLPSSVEFFRGTNRTTTTTTTKNRENSVVAGIQSRKKQNLVFL